MDPVLDFPVPAAPRQHLTRPGHVRTQRSDAVYRFRRGLAGLEHGSFAHDAKGLAAARQRHEALVIVARSKHIAHPLLQPAVALVDGLATARAVPSKHLQVLQHGGALAPTCRRGPVHSPGRRFAPPNPAPPVPVPPGPDLTGCGAVTTGMADTAVRWSD